MQEQRAPYQSFLTRLILLSAALILLASLEVFAAFGQPEVVTARLGTTGVTAEELKLLLLFHFLRQIYVPAILALSSYVLLPRTGLKPLYRLIWVVLLLLQLFFTVTNPLSGPVFKGLRLALLLLLTYFLAKGELSQTPRKRGNG